MNLKLYAVKKGNQKLDRNVQLVVVDLDKGKRYPLNFVCILPDTYGCLKNDPATSPASLAKKACALQRAS